MVEIFLYNNAAGNCYNLNQYTVSSRSLVKFYNIEKKVMQRKNSTRKARMWNKGESCVSVKIRMGERA